MEKALWMNPEKVRRLIDEVFRRCVAGVFALLFDDGAL